MDNYLKVQIENSNLISANSKKAEKMLQSAGLQLPQEETFISFDNSIAYTLANVKGFDKILENNFDNLKKEGNFTMESERFTEEELELIEEADIENESERFTPEEFKLIEDLESSIDPRDEIIENDDGSKNAILTLSDDSYKELASRIGLDIDGFQSGTIDVYANISNDKVELELMILDTDICVKMPTDEYEALALRESLSKAETLQEIPKSEYEWLKNFVQTFKGDVNNIDAYIGGYTGEELYIISKDKSSDKPYTINEYSKETGEVTPISSYDKYSGAIEAIESTVKHAEPINLDPQSSILAANEYEDKSTVVVWREHSPKALAELGEEIIRDETYGTMSLEIAPISYDDRISEETVLSALNDAIKNGEPFSATMEEYAFDIFEYTRDEFEGELLNKVIDEIESNYSGFNTDLLAELSPNETLYELGYAGTEIDIPAFLEQDYKLNIMLATPQEKNLDMVSISDTYNNPDLLELSSTEFAEAADNALTYLINQQGHTTEEVMSAIINDIKTDNEFINSVIQEINNETYSMSELTVLVSARGQNLIDTLDKIAMESGQKRGSKLEISKDTTIGLYNEWNGSGSVLGIELEKPLIISTDMITNIQIEDGGKENIGYTVDDVYGLARSAWKGTIEITDKSPELVKEDLSATFEHIKDLSKENQIDDIKKSKDDFERD